MPPVLADLPPPMQEQIVCSIEAARKYRIPPEVMLAVVEQEDGKPGQWVRNSNGTHDVGPMQFNTAYLRELAGYGITAEDVAAGGCYPFDLAAWRLRGHLTEDTGDMWSRAAYYHSRTPQPHAVYRAQIEHRGNRWQRWLDQHHLRPMATVVALPPLGPPRPPAGGAVVPRVPVMPAVAARSGGLQRTPIQTGYVPRRIMVAGGR